MTRRWWAVVAATGVILAALYLLWAYQRVFHGEPDEENASFREMKFSEGLVMAPTPFNVAIRGLELQGKRWFQHAAVAPLTDELAQAERGGVRGQ